MKRYFLLTVFLTAICSFLSAQSVPYKVVIDVTSMDTLVHQMAVRWVKEITTTDPKAEVEVVLYGKSLNMITKGNSTVSSEVMHYAAMDNVNFKVCAIAMKNNGVDKSQLLAGVKTVPDGIYEIISREHDGWGYIKAAR